MSAGPDRVPSTDPVTRRLDALAEDLDDEALPAPGSTSARRLIDAGRWEW